MAPGKPFRLNERTKSIGRASCGICKSLANHPISGGAAQLSSAETALSRYFGRVSVSKTLQLSKLGL